MNTDELRHRTWLRGYYAQLVNCKVKAVQLKEEDGEVWPVLKMVSPTTGETWNVEVSMDQEGNGPGFLFGLPEPKMPIVKASTQVGSHADKDKQDKIATLTAALEKALEEPTDE